MLVGHKQTKDWKESEVFTEFTGLLLKPQTRTRLNRFIEGVNDPPKGQRELIQGH